MYSAIAEDVMHTFSALIVIALRSLKEIGSPHDIASLISSQRSEIRSLTESLQSERASKQRDMSHAMKSMDCQLHASRTGIMFTWNILDVSPSLSFVMMCDLMQVR